MTVTNEEKQLHFRVPMWVFEEFEMEANKTGVLKGVVQIKAELITSAEAKRQTRLADEHLKSRKLRAVKDVEHEMNMFGGL